MKNSGFSSRSPQWLRDAGAADARAGKSIDAFQQLPLTRHLEAYRAEYEIGYRSVKKTVVRNEGALQILDFGCPYSDCNAVLSIYRKNLIPGSISACHKCNRQFVYRDGFLDKWEEATFPNITNTELEIIMEALENYWSVCERAEASEDNSELRASKDVHALMVKLVGKCTVCGCPTAHCVHDDCSGCGGKNHYSPMPQLNAQR